MNDPITLALGIGLAFGVLIGILIGVAVSPSVRARRIVRELRQVQRMLER